MYEQPIYVLLWILLLNISIFFFDLALINLFYSYIILFGVCTLIIVNFFTWITSYNWTKYEHACTPYYINTNKILHFQNWFRYYKSKRKKNRKWILQLHLSILWSKNVHQPGEKKCKFDFFKGNINLEYLVFFCVYQCMI
jgi:hypothetical protein